MSFKIRNFNGPVHEIFSLEIVGNYSINDERKHSNDITQLKYYRNETQFYVVMDIRQFRHSENFRFFNVIKNRFDYSVNIFYVIYMIIRLEPDLVCLKGILRALL